ncbi:hypothetical protein [Rhodococcoides yunnanense]|uniref:hypothetical protein n=1 Tax=Rhodococcoides yunnanense TaxID=278209 RepID=UPI0009349022|nr:hypothetical protein [Rhodococcus yunnanensis]
MEIATLYAANEDLAGYISELTVGDLSRPTHQESVDIGDLLADILKWNTQVTAGIKGSSVESSTSDTPTKADLVKSANLAGGGFESAYRTTARALEAAYESVEDSRNVAIPGTAQTVKIQDLIRIQLQKTLVATWDVTQALGLYDYSPPVEATAALKDNGGATLSDADSEVIDKILAQSKS